VGRTLEAHIAAVDEEIRALLTGAEPSLQPFYGMMLYHLGLDAGRPRGGKRLRPALCMAGFTIFHSDSKPILPVSAAIEMVHTYSLIHDDLPAMDDDDFRRGVPSCHKKFGEATAILAGDALLTLAFETMSSCRGFGETALLHTTAELARALGTRNGMIAGQVLDLEAEGQSLSKDQVEAIHAAKTGALLSTSVWMGAYLGGASASEAQKVLDYGRKIGLAFQIMDDVLDETGSGETLGKTAGKDREHRKATYPAVFGMDESRRMIGQLTEEACQIVSPLASPTLIEIAGFLEKRCR